MAHIDPALRYEILDVAQRQRVLPYIITTGRMTSGELLKYRNGVSWDFRTSRRQFRLM